MVWNSMLDPDVSCDVRRKGAEEQKKPGSQVIGYGTVGSLLTPRFVECISSGCATAGAYQVG